MKNPEILFEALRDIMNMDDREPLYQAKMIAMEALAAYERD